MLDPRQRPMRGTHGGADDRAHNGGEQRRTFMAVAKVIEITSASSESFEDAIRQWDREGQRDGEGQLRARVDPAGRLPAIGP